MYAVCDCFMLWWQNWITVTCALWLSSLRCLLCDHLHKFACFMIWTFLPFYNHLGVRNTHWLYFLLYVIGSMCSVLFSFGLYILEINTWQNIIWLIYFFVATYSLLWWLIVNCQQNLESPVGWVLQPVGDYLDCSSWSGKILPLWVGPFPKPDFLEYGKGDGELSTLPFLTVDVIWPAAPSSGCLDFPAVTGCTLNYEPFGP